MNSGKGLNRDIPPFHLKIVRIHYINFAVSKYLITKSRSLKSSSKYAHASVSNITDDGF